MPVAVAGLMLVAIEREPTAVRITAESNGNGLGARFTLTVLTVRRAKNGVPSLASARSSLLQTWKSVQVLAPDVDSR